MRDTFQLNSKVAITFDENYTITAVAVDVATGELDTKNDIEDNIVSEKTVEKEEAFDRVADTTEKEQVSGIVADTTVDAANLRQEIAKEYKISEDRIKVFVNGYQAK